MWLLPPQKRLYGVSRGHRVTREILEGREGIPKTFFKANCRCNKDKGSHPQGHRRRQVRESGFYVCKRIYECLCKVSGAQSKRRHSLASKIYGKSCPFKDASIKKVVNLREKEGQRPVPRHLHSCRSPHCDFYIRFA